MLRAVFFLLFTFILSACVTINVYFPAAAAEKAADQIIDQVWVIDKKNKKEDSTKEQETTEEKAPKNEPQNQSSLPYVLLALLISEAQAQVDLDISSPKIQALEARMAERHQTLEFHYDSGALGLTNDGLIMLRQPQAVPLRLRNPIKKAVEEENIDRLDLYREIAVANGHPEWEQQIRNTFAKRWIDKAKIGWWYQDEYGEWQQKQEEFSAS